jgi:hypothetical protein
MNFTRNSLRSLHSCFYKIVFKSKNILVRLAIELAKRVLKAQKFLKETAAHIIFLNIIRNNKERKNNLAVKSENKKNDETFNLMLQLTNSLTDSWLTFC